LIAATLAGIFLFAAPSSPFYKAPALGLDLQGGLQVVLKAKPSGGNKVTSADMTRSISIMRKRVDKLGVSEPDVRTQGTDEIVIDLPGIKDPARAMAVIGKLAQLQLFDLETKLVSGVSVNAGNLVPIPHKLFDLLTLVKSKVKSGNGSSYYIFNTNHNLVTQTSFSNLKQLQTWRRLNTDKTSKSDIVLGVPKPNEVVSCDLATSGICPGLRGYPKAGQTWWYLFSKTPNLAGRDLNANGIRAEFNSSNGPQVDLAFSSNGNKIFHEITRTEWNRGRTYGAQHFAVVLDQELITFPQIDPNDNSLSDGIDPSISGAIIEGIGSMSEANDIATVLQTGALPVKFTTASRTQISATLGKDSLRQAMIAALVGLALVVVFLLALYRFLGLVAVMGLGIYAVFLYGVILLFNVTLSLPGFAGMILTIGVAADANVVVFERIKEESRAGKSVKAAVATGYERGFHTILDANVVTAITAAVLFLVATAGVKGFALMLLLGTGISLITAVAGTRAMLGLLSNFRWFDNPSFMGAHGTQRGRWLQIDFMRKRWLWLAISGVVVLVSASSLGIRGLNLGIDFKGGSQITFKAKPTPLSTIRNIVVNTTGEKSAVVQGQGKTVGGSESYKQFQIRLRSLKGNQQIQNKLMNQLETKVQATSPNIQAVSASFAHDITVSAIKALIVSFLLITAYISLRFDFKFALPVIIAVLHDIVITVGVYALTGREVTTSTVAAVLTVLGYSVYDTIIIFDRVRENVPLMRQAAFARIANVSIWETIRRSLATTFITLLPVGALFFAGGVTLKDFAFALLIGITSGAYSSIFVAAPLLTMWKEREPEFARRLHAQGFQRQESEGPVGKVLPQPAMATATDRATGTGIAPVPDAAKRERRRQRRSSRPHGRPR
jgi:protein-export membrane protein, SecD/SecF family/protein-export membrane protein SecF/protein-export membrane protein SecD